MFIRHCVWLGHTVRKLFCWSCYTVRHSEMYPQTYRRTSANNLKQENSERARVISFKTALKRLTAGQHFGSQKLPVCKSCSGFGKLSVRLIRKPHPAWEHDRCRFAVYPDRQKEHILSGEKACCRNDVSKVMTHSKKLPSTKHAT